MNKNNEGLKPSGKKDKNKAKAENNDENSSEEKGLNKGKNDNEASVAESEEGSQKRWEYLYSQSKIQKMKVDSVRQQKFKEKEQEMFAECTFAPKINKRNPFAKKDDEEENSKENNHIPSVIKRTSDWAKKRNKKIETLKLNRHDKDLDECVFEPEIVK